VPAALEPAKVAVLVDAELVAELERVRQQSGETLEDVVARAIAELLWRWSDVDAATRS
jgi:hypothetical protein